jgi:predicted nuclease of predicted toxin-antitoxin system
VRLLLDECVDARIAGPLRSLGHDVVLVQAIDPSADDRAVLAIATRQERVLVTTWTCPLGVEGWDQKVMRLGAW